MAWNRIALAVIALTMGAPTTGELMAEPVTLHVATNGKDTWSGRMDAPNAEYPPLIERLAWPQTSRPWHPAQSFFHFLFACCIGNVYGVNLASASFLPTTLKRRHEIVIDLAAVVRD